MGLQSIARMSTILAPISDRGQYTIAAYWAARTSGKRAIFLIRAQSFGDRSSAALAGYRSCSVCVHTLHVTLLCNTVRIVSLMRYLAKPTKTPTDGDQNCDRVADPKSKANGKSRLQGSMPRGDECGEDEGHSDVSQQSEITNMGHFWPPCTCPEEEKASCHWYKSGQHGGSMRTGS